MIDKCPMCNTGKLAQYGTSVICDQCSFEHFKASDDYIMACAMLVGTIASNKSFPSQDAFEQHVEHYIEKHLPYLSDFMTLIINGGPEFIKMFSALVLEQALNVTIADEAASKTDEPANDLKCQCGCSDFYLIKTSELGCAKCHAKFVYNEDRALWFPKFICGDCGHNKYSDDGMIATCDKCFTAHMMLKDGGFQLL